MQDLPHHYQITASAAPEGDVTLASSGLEELPSAPPAAFGGPGNRWSPETLLVAAVGDCFVLSFRAIARASKFAWTALHCDVEGILERRDGITRFTEFKVRANLSVPPDANTDRAQRLLEKAEQTCIVTNSLTAATHLEAAVSVRS